MAFNIVHPEFRISVLTLREPTPIEAADILEHLHEFKDVLQHKFVENSTGRCYNCGTWKTRFSDCESGSGQGMKCNYQPTNFQVKFNGYFDKVDFIQVGTWHTDFKSQYNISTADMAKFWLNQFEEFKGWVASKKRSNITNVSIDLARMTSEDRKTFDDIIRKYN